VKGVNMSLASMTGFGRARGPISGRFDASVVARSVNHKYLDVQVRINLRDDLPEAEAAARAAARSLLERGRVTVQVNLTRTEPAAVRVLVDAEGVRSALDQLGALGAGDGGEPVALRDVLALPGLVSVVAEEMEVTDAEADGLAALVRSAVEELVAMRRTEGIGLAEQVRAELGRLEAFLDWFEPQMESVRRRLVERAVDRITELAGPEAATDRDRLLEHAAVQADRADVAEEVVRLRSHVEQFTRRLDEGGTVGRALDFLCQEIGRELNTLGAKCREVGMVEALVDAKTASERIREQIQNLE
jgi:uncharacterized protein (TIGR00255 family)